MKAEYEDFLRQVVEVAVRLNRVEGTFQGVPHYSEFESWAHEMGQDVSRELQMRLLGEVLAQQPSEGRSLPLQGRS
ncbi:MAG: hypothetical protein K6T86_18285 [Pirellulales bacterium]|nr:hypothetical protein [Pirellulales bacterium]